MVFRTGVLVGTLPSGSKVHQRCQGNHQRRAAAAPISTPCCWPAAPRQSRDLPVPGRELTGVHFAMEFLPQQNKVVAGDKVKGQIMATGKHVIVIGGGDTGSDCVGTSNRHGAASVTQFELMPQPPEHENKPLVWPYWPTKLRTSSSHEEGCEREFAIATKEFIGAKGKVTALRTVRVEWVNGKMVEVPGSEKDYPGELVLLAMGFVSPVGRCSTPSAWIGMRAATPWPAPSRPAATRPMWTRFSPPATCAAARAWWSGPSAKAGRPRARWTWP